MKFWPNIKDRIFGIIKETSTQFNTDEEKKRLLESSYAFIDEDEEAELVQHIIDFANTPQIKPIVDKNLNFCHPSTFNIPNGIVSARLSLQGSGGDLIDVFEDFILYATRLLSESGYNKRLLQEEWDKFESDFFQDEVEINFYTHIATFYYHSGGIIEDMISDPNIKVRYLHTDNIKDKMLYYHLKESIEGSFRPASKEEFLQAPAPIIIEYKKRVNKIDRLETHFRDTATIFDKITFSIRIVCGGSAHFDFIKPIFLGNLAIHSELLQNYPSNHLFTNTDATTMGKRAPDETWVTRLWGGIATRDIFEWQFVNQKLRDSFSRVKKNDTNYFFDNAYQLTRQLERIVDLIQALENVIGDHGTDNAEYVAIINARGIPRTQAEIKTKITALYILRNKYLHGRPTGKDSIESEYQNSFHSKIEELESAVNMFEYNLRNILMVSVMNNDFKQRILDYHRALGRDVFGETKQIPHPIPFPTFKTIYY